MTSKLLNGSDLEMEGMRNDQLKVRSAAMHGATHIRRIQTDIRRQYAIGLLLYPVTLLYFSTNSDIDCIILDSMSTSYRSCTVS